MRTCVLLVFLFSSIVRLGATAVGGLGGGNVVLDSDVNFGSDSAAVTGTGAITNAGNANWQLRFTGTGVFSSSGDVTIKVGVVINSQGTSNFFTSTNSITLEGNTVSSTIQIGVTLFYSGSNGAINFKNVVINSVNFSSNGYFFRIGQATGKSFNFEGLEIKGLSKTSGGAVFDLSQSRSSIKFVGCKFSNFSVSGSVIDDSVSVSGLSITNSVFQKIKKTGNDAGGLLYIHGGTGDVANPITLLNTTFEGCTSTFDGGVVYYASTNKGTTLTIELCTVLESSSQKRGGAIFATLNGRLNLINSTFDHCSAKENGGVLMADNYQVQIRTAGITVQSSIFQYCKSISGSGGVFYYKGHDSYTQYDSHFTIAHCDFFYCECATDAGVGYFEQSCLAHCNESVFYNCTAGRKGGAIKMYWSGMELANCTFSKCHAKFGGACNFLMNVELDFYDCLFTYNSAVKFGGAVAFERRTGDTSGERITFRMRRCYLTGNTLQDSNGYGLDVVFMDDDDLDGTGKRYNNWYKTVYNAYVDGNFTGSYSSSVNNSKRVYVFYNGADNLPANDYIKQWEPVKWLEVSTTGTNSQDGCGYKDVTYKQCRDIAYASSRLNIDFDYTVQVQNGVYYEQLITVQLNKRLTVLGFGRGDPYSDLGTRIIPQYDRFYSALFICHYPDSGLILNALSFEQSNPNYKEVIRSAVYLNTPDATGFLKIIDCCFYTPSPLPVIPHKGCLIYSMGHNVSVENTTFDNFTTSAQHGGVIRFGKKKTNNSEALSLDVRNSEFISCKTNVDNGINGGGAVFVEGSARTNFVDVRFEWCVGRAFVFDYGRNEDMSDHTFDKCVFVYNKAVLGSAENPPDYKGSALACLYEVKTASYVNIYFEHCYFGENEVTNTATTVPGHDVGFITVGPSNTDQSYWNTLIQFDTTKTNGNFWDCYSDGQLLRVWSTNADGAIGQFYADPPLKTILNYYYRPTPLRVSHTRHGFDGEYCGCDHVPCHTIAFAYTHTGDYPHKLLPKTYELWIAPVVNNETATVYVKEDQTLVLLKKPGERKNEEKVSPTINLDQTKVLIGLAGDPNVEVSGAVQVFVSQNDTKGGPYDTTNFFDVRGDGTLIIKPGVGGLDPPTLKADSFHFLHNSSSGDHSLFYFETTSEKNVLEWVEISDGTNGTYHTIGVKEESEFRAGAFTRGLLTVKKGKVVLTQVHFYSLKVDNGGSIVDVQPGAKLDYISSVVGGNASGLEVSGKSRDCDGSCVFRINGGIVNMVSVTFAGCINTHAVIITGSGELTTEASTFDNSVTPYNGSCILADLITGGKLILKGTRFVNSGSQSAYSCGGAIHVELGEPGQFYCYGFCQFVTCFAATTNAIGYGGAVFLRVVGICRNFDFSSGIQFFGNQATKGKTIYVQARELREIMDPAKFTGLYFAGGESLVEKNNLEDGDLSVPDRNELAGTMNDTLATATHIPLVYFFFRYTGPLYINNNANSLEHVHDSGYDRFWCGRIILPCLTITEANTVSEGTVSHHPDVDPDVSRFILVGTVQLYDDYSMNGEVLKGSKTIEPDLPVDLPLHPSGIEIPTLTHTPSKRNELSATVALRKGFNDLGLKIESGAVRATLVLTAFNGADYLYTVSGALNITNFDILPTQGTFSLSGTGSSLVVINIIVKKDANYPAKKTDAVIKLADGDLIITNSTFSDIAATSDASAVHAVVAAGKKFTILNSKFENCKSTGANGGALYVEVGTVSGSLLSVFTIEDNYNSRSGSQTSFKDCGAGGGKGGSIYLKLGKDAPYRYLFGGVLNITRSDEYAGNSDVGPHIYVEAEELNRKVINRRDFEYPQYTLPYKVVGDIDACYENLPGTGNPEEILQGIADPKTDITNPVDLRPYLVGYPGGTVYVWHNPPPGGVGKDTNACGFWETPCATIKRAVINAIDFGLESFKVGVIEPSPAHDYVFEFPTGGEYDKALTINVTGIVRSPEGVKVIDGHARKTINALATTAVVVVRRSLTISPFAFKPQGSVGVFITVEPNGYLNLTDSSFTAITTSDQLIVLKGGADALFTKVSFTGISSGLGGGKGSALVATVASGKFLRLIGCDFKDCKNAVAPEAASNGGAIHVTLNDGGIFSVSGTDSLPSTFYGNGHDTQTQFGGGVFLQLIGFSLDFSRSSYFEFVGNLKFGDVSDPDKENHAACGRNIYISHTGSNDQIINRQTFDFLISEIDSNPTGYDAGTGVIGSCTSVITNLASSDPVYVSMGNSIIAGNDASPNGDVCSRTKPCASSGKAISTSEGTYTSGVTRSVNVRFFSDPVGNEYGLNAASLPGKTGFTVSGWSFKGVKVFLVSGSYQETPELANITLTGTIISNLKLSFEYIKFLVGTGNGLLIQTADSVNSEVSLLNCVVSPTVSNYVWTSGLFDIKSNKFVFSSRVGDEAREGTVRTAPIIKLETVSGGTYEFKDAIAALFAGIKGEVSLLKVTSAVTGGGDVSISNSTVSSVDAAAGVSIFDVNAKTLTVSNMTFAAITTQIGSYVISTGSTSGTTTKSGGILSIADSTFLGSGVGGAVYAKNPSSVSFTGSLSFSGSTYATHIYLEAKGELDQLVHRTSFSYTNITLTLDDKGLDFYEDILPRLNELQGTSDKEDPLSTVEVSLWYYLLGQPTPVFAGPDYTAFSVCGYYPHPCTTFEKAIGRGSDVDGVFTIYVVEREVGSTKKLDFPKTTTLIAKPTPEYIISGVKRYNKAATTQTLPPKVGGDSGDVYGTVNVPAGGTGAYLTTASFSLTLNYIVVELADNIGTTLFSFSGTSRLSLNYVKFEGQGGTSSTASESIISYTTNGIPLNIIHSTFSKINLNTGSVVSIDGDLKDVLIDTTDFTDVKRSVGSGAAISTTPDSIRWLKVKASKFRGITSSSGNGGALSVELTNGGAFIVEDGSFDNCVASSGYGGAVYLKLGAGFSILGNSTFEFNETGAGKLIFGSIQDNDATYGNNVFVDGSEGIDLSNVVHSTTFDFSLLKEYVRPTTTGDHDCDDWMGFNLNNTDFDTDLKWLNRYIDRGCFLFSDGCPSHCVLDFEATTVEGQCIEVNSCPIKDGLVRSEHLSEDGSYSYCLETACTDRKTKTIDSSTIPVKNVCPGSYSRYYDTSCGGANCFANGGVCTDDCPENSKKENGKCVELKCEEQVVCPDGKVPKEGYCVNDTCVSESTPSCGGGTDCVEVYIPVKDAFGYEHATDKEPVCRSKFSSTYKKYDSSPKPLCGNAPNGGGPCFLNASETGVNKCITDCDGPFVDPDKKAAGVCENFTCAERTVAQTIAAGDKCGDDCYYFADHLQTPPTTTTRNPTICMIDCPQFYYDKNGDKICAIRENCTDRTYSSFVCPEGKKCGPGEVAPFYPEDPSRLTCGPGCYFKNYSTSCDEKCDPDFFIQHEWEEKDPLKNGWGYCDLKLCEDRTGRAWEQNCQEYPGEECHDSQYDVCKEDGTKEHSTHECVVYRKEKALLVGGKGAEDTLGCGGGNRPNCKTVSYAVTRAERSCDKSIFETPTILVTADIIETARAAHQIDITGINLRSQSTVKRLTINMVYRASFVVGPYDKATTISNLIFNTFTIRDTNKYAPLFYTKGDTPLGSLTLNGVVVNYAVSDDLAQKPTFLNNNFNAWVADLKGVVVNFNKSLINNRIVDLPPSAGSLSSFLSASSYRLTRLDLSVMFDLDFSDDPEFEAEFLDRFSPVIVSLASSTLASRSSLHKQSNENKQMCNEPFPYPAVLLDSLTGSFDYSNFSNINAGALKLTGGADVTLNGVAFYKNRISYGKTTDELPSMRHNVYVSRGTKITVTNLIGESPGSYFLQRQDGTEDKLIADGGIVARDGTEDNNEITPFNELFTPVFTDSIITPADDGASFILTLRGGMLFPCDPTLVLFRDNDELGRYEFAKEEFSISGESSLSVNISSNADSYYEAVGEYKALLEYEPHQRSDRFTYHTVYGIAPSKAKANLKPLWWILVALGILILLLLALVIFLYIRMKMKQKELEQDAAEARIRAQVRRDQQINKQRADQRRVQEKKTVKEPVKKANLIFANDINSNEDSFGAWEAGADEWVVDARRCEHPFGVVQCDRRRTLFALYTELSAQALNTSTPQETFQSMLPQKLKNPMAPMLGLAQLMNRLYQENPNVPVDHISPHTLLVSTKGSLALVLKKDAVKNTSGDGREVGGAFESIRWNAPELKFEETPTLASDIFSYSLVAWQIATPMHEVPFAEVDAQSASTRMATGYRPVTQGLDYRLVGLFENAWKQEPDERSTVQEIIDTLQAGGPPAGGDQWDSDGSSGKGSGGNSSWKAPSMKKDAPLLDDAGPNANW